MKKTFFLSLIAFSMTATAAFAQAEGAPPAPPAPTTLEVSADADIKAAPDIALISAGVVTSAPTATAAMQENANKMAGVQAALKKAGIAEKDIQTAGININPQYAYKENEAPRVTGYQASNTVNVALRDLKAAGGVLDALVSQGANQINGPTFSIENPEDLLNKARADAVKKAQKRAEIYAGAAGLRIKRVLAISETTQYNPPPRPMMMMKSAMAMEDSGAATSVSPGELALSVAVNIRYELTP